MCHPFTFGRDGRGPASRSRQPGRAEVELDGVVVPVVGREHFIQNKKAVERTQDLADTERLSAGNSEQA